jgi:regulator of protease activity HflC (stomatin/prohibitin superfamily)
MEKRAFRLNGFLALLVLAADGYAIWLVLAHPEWLSLNGVGQRWALAGAIVIAILLLSGLTVVNPNEARVVQFFGWYVGTLKNAGFHWAIPLAQKRRVSVRVRNFETARLKVSDADGNPVEIAAVVVWQVVDTGKARFAVDNHITYVSVQAEAAVRHLATSYPYEAHEQGRTSLRDSDVVSDVLTTELRERVALAGVEVLESRVTHLAYAPEIAQAMLARQQASAIVAARFKIVEGAVGMVQQALQRLREQGVIELDEERKAQMVANLLVVLCGDRAAQPVVNTGTLYG